MMGVLVAIARKTFSVGGGFCFESDIDTLETVHLVHGGGFCSESDIDTFDVE